MDKEVMGNCSADELICFRYFGLFDDGFSNFFDKMESLLFERRWTVYLFISLSIIYLFIKQIDWLI